ncbi:MAG: hypothetical protein Q9174_001564 [Haloplaca sp. 1 TL-2023]
MAQTASAPCRKNIVILGGSYGGVSTAHNVLKHTIPKLSNKETYQIILVSPSSHTICRPATPRALISDSMFDQERLFVSIPQAFEQYPQGTFRFINGAATNLDHTNRSVTIIMPNNQTEKLHYHALVIATGASTSSPLFGLNHDEETLRNNWKAFRTALPAARSIIIAGGGPTGIETAGELGEYLNGRPSWFSSFLSSPSNPKVNITVLTSASKILPQLRDNIGWQAEHFLKQLGVTVHVNARVKAVSPTGAGVEADKVAAKTTVTLEDGRTMDADLYIPAFGTAANTGFVDKESGLLNEDGRVKTNASTLRVDGAGPRVYAVGDVASYSRPAIHLLMEAIPVLCTNIKHDLLAAEGGGEEDGSREAGVKVEGKDRLYTEDMRETQLVPIGTWKGVGSVMGWRVPALFVWAIKGRDYWLWTTGALWSGKQWSKEP